MNLSALLFAVLHSAAPASSPASARWPVPSVSAVLDSGLLVQTGDTLRGVVVRGTCETALTGLWDGRRFRLNLRPLRGGTTVPARLEFLYPDSLAVHLQGPSPCAGDTTRRWDLSEKTPTLLDAIAVPVTDSLAQGLGQRRFLARTAERPTRAWEEPRATALDRLRERFARFELEVPSADEALVQLVDMEGEYLTIPVRNHRILPSDSFPAVSAVTPRGTPRTATGLSYLQAGQRMLGLKILADSSLGGWSLQQPTFAHNTIHVRGTLALVSPEGRTTLQVQSSSNSFSDVFPVPGSLVASPANLCAEAARSSIEPWLAEMVLWLRSQSDTSQRLPALPQVSFPTAVPVGDTLSDGTRLCLGQLTLPWKSERDSGTVPTPRRSWSAARSRASARGPRSCRPSTAWTRSSPASAAASPTWRFFSRGCRAGRNPPPWRISATFRRPGAA